MTILLRKLFWLALFLVFTVGFVTLFDHGFTTSKQFTDDAKSEVNDLAQVWHQFQKSREKSAEPAK